MTLVTSNIKKAMPNYSMPDPDILSAAFWGNVPNGTPIENMDKALINAQDRFAEQRKSNENFEFLPLVNPFPDQLVKAAIYGHNESSALKTSNEIFEKAMRPYHEQILKQYAYENPETDVAKEITKAINTGSSLMHIIADQEVIQLY